MPAQQARAALPTALLREAVAAGRVRPDAAQEAVAERLDHVAAGLDAAPGKARAGGWFSRLGFGARQAAPEPPPGPQGLYIHGPVGRGKSMLMDLFFAAAPVADRRRVHFHAFMLEIHDRLHRRRQARAEADPIGPVAREIAAEARLLCFDEFQVTNIADAMILGRLFQGLFDAGVTVVATSNTRLQDLYAGGLQRDRFLPAIALLRARLEEVALDGPDDYRRDRIRGMAVYHAPLGPAAAAALDRAFAELTEGAGAEPLAIAVQGRSVTLRAAARGVARASFRELCEAPLGPADYLAIARTCHTLVLEGIPVLTAERRNEARRFVTLVDALYEHRAKLVCSAAAQPDALHAAGDHAAEFRRTASRLHEMQSAEYLAAPHAP
ncbi:MAG: cell division protein ZapE [Alphaproteobacteria bacterium]|jgi:cell division protein ZapE